MRSKRSTRRKSGILCSVMPGARIFKIVVMKLIAPRIDDVPARWSEKITKSMAGPGVPLVESDASMVQPVPMPWPPGGPGTKSA